MVRDFVKAEAGRSRPGPYQVETAGQDFQVPGRFAQAALETVARHGIAYLFADGIGKGGRAPTGGCLGPGNREGTGPHRDTLAEAFEG
jgi:hypothetical protein